MGYDNFGLKIGVEGEREFKRLSPILISPLRYCVTANLSCPAIDGVCCPDAARVIAPKKKGLWLTCY
jgi:hypothetical protein